MGVLRIHLRETFFWSLFTFPSARNHKASWPLSGSQLNLEISGLALLLLLYNNQVTDWYWTGLQEKLTLTEGPALIALFSVHNFLCVLFYVRRERRLF